jgi:hypothetical protein
MEYYSTIRQKKCMSFVGKWMEMDGDHYVKWNKPDLEKQYMFFSSAEARLKEGPDINPCS